MLNHKKTLKQLRLIVLAIVMLVSVATCGLLQTKAEQGVKELNDATQEIAAPSGLELNKYVTTNTDGTYNISLEAYATGKVRVETNQLPTDIVLVLDQSGSMATEDFTTSSYSKVSKSFTYKNFSGDYYFRAPDGMDYLVGKMTYTVKEPFLFWTRDVTYYTLYYRNADGTIVYIGTPSTTNNKTIFNGDLYTRQQTKVSRLEGLKDAVDSFITTVKNDAATRNVDNRIAIVGFASSDKFFNNNTPYNNTELFVGNSTYRYNSANISANYGNAFQSVNKNTGISNLTASVGKLEANGATSSHLGLEMANNIFAAYSSDYTSGKRNKVIIMFTDGVPTGITSGSNFDSEVANAAIEKSAIAQNTYGAKVYTAGIVEGLDPSTQPTDNDSNNRMNRYMQYVSSNYPNATELNSGGTGGNYKAGYFMKAQDADDLKAIFSSITSNLSSAAIEMNSTTILQDVITDEFKIPESGNVVSVETYDYVDQIDPETNEKITGFVSDDSTTGITDVSNQVTISIDRDKRIVQVTGFDYSNNYCIAGNGSDITTKGKKLVVTIRVERSNTLGGKDIPSNGIGSGIYNNDGKPVGTFPIPKIDLEVKDNLITDIDGNDVDIYLSQSVNCNDLIKQVDSVIPNGSNNEFLDITYTIKDGSGNTVAERTVLAGTDIRNEDLFNNEIVGLTNNTSYTVISTMKYKGTDDVAKVTEKISNVNVYKPTVTCSDQTVFYGEKNIESLDKRISVSWLCASDSNKNTTPKGDAPSLQYTMIDNKTGNVIQSVDSLQNTVNIKITDVLVGTTSIKDNTIIVPYKNCPKQDHDQTCDFAIHVAKGQIEIKKTIDEQYGINFVNLQLKTHQTFIFKVERRETAAGDVKDTFYQTITFDASKSDTTLSKKISDLKKGYYTVTEETSWSSKYTLVSDNGLSFNIGEKTDNGYVGIDDDTECGASYGGTHAVAEFTNNRKLWVGWNSDAASSTNKYNK